MGSEVDAPFRPRADLAFVQKQMTGRAVSLVPNIRSPDLRSNDKYCCAHLSFHKQRERMFRQIFVSIVESKDQRFFRKRLGIPIPCCPLCGGYAVVSGLFEPFEMACEV